MRAPPLSLPQAARGWAGVAMSWLPFADVASRQVPLQRLVRLALFQVGIGMTSVLLNGTLNRVMIVELGAPAALVALMIALPLVVAPFRALIGHRSDQHRSVLGWRRVPYIWLGSLMQFGGLSIMPFALLLLSRPELFAAGVLASGLAFVLAGSGVHVTQTAGLALATDLVAPQKRPRVVALLYVMLLAGMMFAALGLGGILLDFTPTLLVQVVQGAAVLTIVLNLIALWKQEGRSARPTGAGAGAGQVAFSRVWASFIGQPRAARLLLAIGLGAGAFAMQDALLEPYGGEVLAMTVGATTILSACWALGALAGFGLSARALDRGFDPLRLAGFGVVIGILAFLMVLFAAPISSPVLLGSGAAGIGLGLGLFSVGTLVAAMALAKGDDCGLALGAWGAVQASCAGLAILVGGVVRDVLSNLADAGEFGPALASRATGYLAVYIIEIIILLATLVALGPLVGQMAAQSRGARGGTFGLTQFPT